MVVAAIDIARLAQKFIPCLSMNDRTINMTSDGITSQNICIERSAMRPDGMDSMWSQTKASNEVRGSDATRAAKPECRLAISEIARISKADTAILMM